MSKKRSYSIIKKSENIKYFTPIVERDINERISNDEYSVLLHNQPFWNDITNDINKESKKSWYERSKSDMALTFDDISIDEFINYINENQGMYLDGNKLTKIGKSYCERIGKDKNGNIIEPPIITYKYPGTEKYWVHTCESKNIYAPEMVYICTIKINDIPQYVKTGKADNGFYVREGKYNTQGKIESKYTYITERYLKELLLSGYEVEWYAIIVPTQLPKLVGDGWCTYKNSLDADGLEKWIRNAMFNKFNKKFIENI